MWRFLLCALIVTSVAVPAAKRGDFSGEWRMDPARSESAHQDVPTGSSTVLIRLTDSGLSMETTRHEMDKSEAFHETLNFQLDGSETTSMGAGNVPVTGKAHWNGEKLVVETVRNVNNSTVSAIEIHTLSPNGREMTIDKTLTVQHGYMGQSAPTMGHGKDIFVRVDRP